MSKKPAPKQTLNENTTSSPTKANYTSLLIAGTAGFALAFVLLKGYSNVPTCPMYSEACPVTSTLQVLETDLQNGDLPKAKQSAAKLSEYLRPTMPDLAKITDAIATSRNLAAANAKVEILKNMIMSDLSAVPNQ
jgi:hypothetical protein